MILWTMVAIRVHFSEVPSLDRIMLFCSTMLLFCSSGLLTSNLVIFLGEMVEEASSSVFVRSL